MKRLASIASAFILIAVFAPRTGAVVPDPLTCVGYAQPRVFLDAQGWWTAEGAQTGTNFGHIHVSTCFPLNQTVSGVVPFDIQIVMHKNPGTVVTIVPQLCYSTGQTCLRYPDIGLDLRCDPVTEVTCTSWVHYDWDTSLYQYDGRTTFRFRTEVLEPDGTLLRTANEWLARVANGHPIRDFKPGTLIGGKGWYSFGHYSAGWIDGGYPQPVTTGPWKVRFHCTSTKTAETTTPPLGECLVTVDPDFHNGNEGTVLYRSTSGSQAIAAVQIDLSTLAPGAHALVIRSTSVINPPSGPSTKAGILKVPFTVG